MGRSIGTRKHLSACTPECSFWDCSETYCFIAIVLKPIPEDTFSSFSYSQQLFWSTHAAIIDDRSDDENEERSEAENCELLDSSFHLNDPLRPSPCITTFALHILSCQIVRISNEFNIGARTQYDTSITCLTDSFKIVLISVMIDPISDDIDSRSAQ